MAADRRIVHTVTRSRIADLRDVRPRGTGGAEEALSIVKAALRELHDASASLGCVLRIQANNDVAAALDRDLHRGITLPIRGVAAGLCSNCAERSDRNQ
jgi:hypothetical protein